MTFLLPALAVWRRRPYFIYALWNVYWMLSEESTDTTACSFIAWDSNAVTPSCSTLLARLWQASTCLERLGFHFYMVASLYISLLLHTSRLLSSWQWDGTLPTSWCYLLKRPGKRLITSDYRLGNPTIFARNSSLFWGSVAGRPCKVIAISLLSQWLSLGQWCLNQRSHIFHVATQLLETVPSNAHFVGSC